MEYNIKNVLSLVQICVINSIKCSRQKNCFFAVFFASNLFHCVLRTTQPVFKDLRNSLRKTHQDRDFSNLLRFMHPTKASQSTAFYAARLDAPLGTYMSSCPRHYFKGNFSVKIRSGIEQSKGSKLSNNKKTIKGVLHSCIRLCRYVNM